MLKLQYGNKTIINSARTGYVGYVPPPVPNNTVNHSFANSVDDSRATANEEST